MMIDIHKTGLSLNEVMMFYNQTRQGFHKVLIKNKD